MITAYIKLFENYFDFKGRSTRSDYWYAYLFNFIICSVFRVFLEMSTTTTETASYQTTAYESTTNSNAVGAISFIVVCYSLIIFIPSLAVTVRRLHDTGKSGWNVLISLVPLIGSIILIIWLATDSDYFENQYGECPKIIENDNNIIQ